MSSLRWRDRGNGNRAYLKFRDPNGNQRELAAGKTKKEANAFQRRIDLELANETFGKHEDICFSDFAEKWFFDYADLRLKPTTKADYRQVINKHLNPYFGRHLLKNVTTCMVQSYFSKKGREGLSPRTVNKTLTLLRLMMKHAVHWGYISENPALCVDKLPQTNGEMSYLRPEELHRLLSASSEEYRPLFATAALTGAREGELLALRWSDIDFEKKVIFISRSYNPLHGFSEPKTRSAKRPVTISDSLVSILLDHHHRTGGEPEDLVFSNKSGKPISRQNMVTREFYPALERAGLPRIRFHDLRHTYATLLISMGENVKFIQRQLGHARITTTLDTYGHLMPEAYEGFGGRFDSFLFPE